MRRKWNPVLPSGLEAGRRCFEHWRKTRRRRSRIPESLWSTAVKLAGAYGLSRTAQVLRLNAHSLKQQVEVAGSARSESASASFVELVPTVGGPLPECIVELEDVQGTKMRIHVRGGVLPDLGSLGRTFWEGRP
jgi:hypothetical protein